MINLTIDIGNSSVKAALFDNRRLVRHVESGKWREESFEGAIVVSTRGEMPEIEREVRDRARFFVKFDHSTPVPIKNLYETPATLGYDRLAAAVGAHARWSGETVLVVDFGTAITCDIVTAAGEFLGGVISPGAGIRFRALHDYTRSLPLCTLPESGPDFPARDTKSAVESGVATGIVAETEHYIAVSQAKYGASRVIFTGGDADYFAGRVNFPIFATPELVLEGLNAILEHNANL